MPQVATGTLKKNKLDEKILSGTSEDTMWVSMAIKSSLVRKNGWSKGKRHNNIP